MEIKMNKGIVFFDFDGTLVDETKKIFRPTETTLESIERLKENGYLTVLATGRAKCYVPQTGIEWDGYITSNGAHAELLGKTVYDRFMPWRLVKRMMDKADDFGYIYVLENQELCYTNGLENANFVKTLSTFDIPDSTFRPVSEADEPPVHKMFLTFERMEAYEDVTREFEGEMVFGMHRTSMSCDADMAGTSKGIGIGRLAEAAGVGIESTYAFGDSVNDYEMLKNVGTGIAMGDHVPSLENVCSFVTETVEHEGITVGLEKAGLL